MAKMHFLRYGTAAEQRYMRDYQHTFDGVAINGSMLAHISKGISAFMHKDINKHFFIDPMTHSFQHRMDKIQNSAGEIKSSIRKLIEIYDEPITLVINKLRPIRSIDFNPRNIPTFVKNVLDFQHFHLKRNLDSEYSDYIEYMGLFREPSFLIAPYFYMQAENYQQWIDLNKKLIDETLKKKSSFKGKKIFGEIVIDRKLLLDRQLINKLIEIYSKADGLIYWIDGFEETEADELELEAVKWLIEEYKKKYPSKQIISLYSGYFSELLLGRGLDGIVHGLEYGESRDVVPVGGGIPLSKYYLPDLRKRISAATMLRLLKLLKINSPKLFHSKICSCRVCMQIIHNNVIEDFNKYIQSKPDPVIIRYKKSGNIREIFYPERASKELCLFHYLEVKNNEFKFISKDGIANKIRDLRNTYDKYKEYLPEEEITYLLRWAKVLG